MASLWAVMRKWPDGRVEYVHVNGKLVPMGADMVFLAVDTDPSAMADAHGAVLCEFIPRSELDEARGEVERLRDAARNAGNFIRELRVPQDALQMIFLCLKTQRTLDALDAVTQLEAP